MTARSRLASNRVKPVPKAEFLSLKSRRSSTHKLLGANQLERCAHFGIGTAPRELGGQSPEIDPVFAVKGIDPETMLLDVMMCGRG